MSDQYTSVADRNLNIEKVPVDQLSPYSKNPRTHSKKQIQQVADSIAAFGFTNPVLVDERLNVLAGHGRIEAAKLLKLSAVPVVRLEEMTEAQKRAYIIADNKLAENAGWDRELLAVEFQQLLDLDLDFEVGITGFEMGEIDVLLGDLSDELDQGTEDALPDLSDGPSVSQAGDMWALGPHRLFCGDSLNPESYQLLLGGQEARMVFTDPPYNVPINGHVSGLGSVKHDEFAMASGEMSEQEFIDFLERVFENQASVCADGAINFICMDWKHSYEVLMAGRVVFDELKNICVWAKTNGGMGSLYRSRHELVFVFKKGTAPHINNVQLGRLGRNRTNVWEYAGMNVIGAERDEDLAMHPTVKPVAMIEDAIKDCSNRGDIILDPFMGSGSTLIAAHRAGRRAYGIELSPRYVDVILERFARETGIDPVHVTSGLGFEELK